MFNSSVRSIVLVLLSKLRTPFQNFESINNKYYNIDKEI